MPEKSSSTRKLLATGALVLAGALWGASFLFGKLAFRHMEVLHVVLLRCLIGGLVLLPFALKHKPPRIRDLPMIFFIGLLLVPGTLMLQFLGLERTTASSASLIIGGIPPLLALASHVFLRQRLDWLGWLAVIMSTLGVLCIVGFPGRGTDLLGDLLVFLSLLSVITWILLMRGLVSRYGALATTAYVLLAGTLLLSPIVLAMHGLPDLIAPLSAWGAVLALGFGSTALTYTLWNWGMKQAQVASAGVFTNIEPLVGAALGILILGEEPGLLLVLGGVLILSAAVLVTLDRKTKNPQITG